MPTARQVWDAPGAGGSEGRRVGGHSGGVFAVCWSPDGRWLVSADKTACVALRRAPPWVAHVCGPVVPVSQVVLFVFVFVLYVRSTRLRGGGTCAPLTPRARSVRVWSRDAGAVVPLLSGGTYSCMCWVGDSHVAAGTVEGTLHVLRVPVPGEGGARCAVALGSRVTDVCARDARVCARACV